MVVVVVVVAVLMVVVVVVVAVLMVVVDDHSPHSCISSNTPRCDVMSVLLALPPHNGVLMFR
jgi:hypothetical protein